MNEAHDVEHGNPLIDFSSIETAQSGGALSAYVTSSNIRDSCGKDDVFDQVTLVSDVDSNYIDYLPTNTLKKTAIANESLETLEDKRTAEEFNVLLASTYVLEAAHGRNGTFIPEAKPLRTYRLYNHPGVRVGLFLVIAVNLMLALFEDPAVPGLKLPYYVTQTVELVCMAAYFVRVAHGWKFMPQRRHWRDKKVIVIFVCVLLTIGDIAISLILKQVRVERNAIRWSRILRPAFMINFSESRQVRRTVRNIRRTVPEIANVLVLFLVIIGLYALLGLKLFEKRFYTYPDGKPYFTNYWDNFFNLYVLTTTANNPDIMIPSYNKDNWFALFFVVFVIICMYIFVSIFLAVVYKNYRMHLKNEVKASVYRKRRNMKAAFDCLKVRQAGDKSRFVVPFHRWKQLMHFTCPKMHPVHMILLWKVLDENETKELEFRHFVHLCDLLHIRMEKVSTSMNFFERLAPLIYRSKISSFIRRCVAHRLFVYFFDVVIIANAICIALDEDRSELLFLTLFNLEILLKFYALGPKQFVAKFWNIFDVLVIGAATVLYVLEAIFDDLQHSPVLFDLLLILRVLRLFKIIGNINRFQVIINTILQIGPAILTYGGIMFVLYYIYATMGMELFHGRVKSDGIYPSDTFNLTAAQRKLLFCGNPRLNSSEFVRLQYCQKNFNDILKAFSILFDLTMVNNWHVFTDGFVLVTNKAARLYFWSFHLLCVIVVLNIFVAFILEAFMLQYTFSQGKFEASLQKKVEEKGIVSPSSSATSSMSRGCSLDRLPRLDSSASVGAYVEATGASFRLAKTRTKNAELLLQQMFEDELDERDLGPELTDLDADLDAAVERVEGDAQRKLTLQTVDLWV